MSSRFLVVESGQSEAPRELSMSKRFLLTSYITGMVAILMLLPVRGFCSAITGNALTGTSVQLLLIFAVVFWIIAR